MPRRTHRSTRIAACLACVIGIGTTATLAQPSADPGGIAQIGSAESVESQTVQPPTDAAASPEAIGGTAVAIESPAAGPIAESAEPDGPASTIDAAGPSASGASADYPPASDGQSEGTIDTLSTDPTAATPYPPIAKSGGGEWVVAPVPGYNPSQTWTLSVLAQYIVRPQPGSTAPPNIVGIAGVYTGKESVGGAIFHSGSHFDDTWRLRVGGGYFNLNYDFFGVGSDAGDAGLSVPIEQDTWAFLLQPTRRINDTRWFVGPRFRFTSIDAIANSTGSDLVLPTDQFAATTIGLGIAAVWDSTDVTLYPTRGGIFNIRSDFFSEAFGSDYDYQIYEAEYNHYFKAQPKGVVAVRAFTRYAGGDAPFFALSQFGRRNDNRGYEAGRYRDRLMLATQAEYRHRFSERWGGVAFAGVGGVVPTLWDFTSDDLLPSGGLGVRFRIARQNPVDFRGDWAYGRDGSEFYFGVGQAF